MKPRLRFCDVKVRRENTVFAEPALQSATFKRLLSSLRETQLRASVGR